MKNKNGFTIVEVLATIAIIALLLVFIIPSVRDKYLKAQEESFVNEIKNIYDAALNQYSYDQIRSGNTIIYCYDSNDSYNRNSISLIDEDKNISYYVKVENGIVVENIFMDLNDKFTYNATINKLSDIKRSNIIKSIDSSFSCSDYMSNL